MKARRLKIVGAFALLLAAWPAGQWLDPDALIGKAIDATLAARMLSSAVVPTHRGVKCRLLLNQVSRLGTIAA